MSTQSSLGMEYRNVFSVQGKRKSIQVHDNSEAEQLSEVDKWMLELHRRYYESNLL